MAQDTGPAPIKVRDRNLALDEYREALQYLRHDDQQAWTIIGLSATLAVAVWAYALKDGDMWALRTLVATGIGAAALVVGRLMAWRISAHTESRKRRAIELEAKLGFELVTKLHERMPRTCAPGVNCTLHVIAWTVALAWVAYFGAFITH